MSYSYIKLLSYIATSLRSRIFAATLTEKTLSQQCCDNNAGVSRTLIDFMLLFEVKNVVIGFQL